ncbi:resistin-like beta [Bombina bombina]|uniref:resistin-like beta n=1 Tax=Bombina bombina TaxID=8345 RepID=UPI00235AD6C0|nr:resistin-like beta [Bombina bombina]
MMKLGVSFIVLFLFPSLIRAETSTCTIDDLLRFSSLLKTMAAEVLDKAKIVCSDTNARGAYASCPGGTVPVSCACGMGCGSWDIQASSTCHCQCGNMDWTTARCCNLSPK